MNVVEQTDVILQPNWFSFFLSLHSSIPAETSSRAKLVNWQHSAAAAARDQVHERGNEWNMVELARFRELKGEQWLTNCAKETWKSYQYKKLIPVSLLSYIRIVACRHLAKSFDIRNDMCLLTNCFFANKTREPKQSELMWRPAKQHRHVSNSRNLNFASVCTYCNGLRKNNINDPRVPQSWTLEYTQYEYLNE